MHQIDHNCVVCKNLTDAERKQVVEGFYRKVPESIRGFGCSDILLIVDALNTYIEEINDAWEEFPGAQAKGFEAAVSALLLIGEPLTEARLKELLRQS